MSIFEPMPRVQTRSDEPAQSSWISPTVDNAPPANFGEFFDIAAVALWITAFGIAFHWGSWLPPVFAAILHGGAVTLSRWPHAFRVLSAPFAPEGSNWVDDVAARITIYVNLAPIGRDQGVMGFDGDLLFFAGSASSFALGRQDIDFYYSLEMSWKSHVPMKPNSLVVRVIHPNDQVELLVEGSAVEIAELRKSLRILKEKGRPSSGHRSYPPMDWPELPDPGRASG